MENFTLLPSSRDVVSAMRTSNRSAFLPPNPAVVRKARVRAGPAGRMGRKRRVKPGQVYLRLTHVQEPCGSNLMLSEKVSKLVRRSLEETQLLNSSHAMVKSLSTTTSPWKVVYGEELWDGRS